MPDSGPIDLAEFVKRGQQMAAAKLGKWGYRWLWFSVALVAASIIFTEWRLIGLGVLAGLVGSAHFYAAASATRPDVASRITEAYRQKLAEDPNWRPKVQP